MEDRYLFKAKRVDWREFPEKEQWITGYYVLGFNEYEQPVHLIFEPTSMFFSHGETDGWTEVDPSTICRCTGLKDKNGNLIWENDIIKYHFGNVYAQIRYGAYQSCFDSQKTEHIGFYVDWSESRNYRKDLGYWINMVNAEVVGNIFDNPELLESEE